MNGFTLKTAEDFKKFKEENDTISVNFGLQFTNLLEAGELIFMELEDGYAHITQKKGFGFSKPKSEIYICGYDEPLPQIYRHKDAKKAVAMFEQFHKDGTELFYVKGLG